MTTHSLIQNMIENTGNKIKLAPNKDNYHIPFPFPISTPGVPFIGSDLITHDSPLLPIHNSYSVILLHYKQGNPVLWYLNNNELSQFIGPSVYRHECLM